MELLSSSTASATGSADPVAEVRRLRRQLRRERARRQAAESIGERATADLYDSVRELRTAQVELLERADQTRVVNELARALRRGPRLRTAGQPGGRVRRTGYRGGPV